MSANRHGGDECRDFEQAKDHSGRGPGDTLHKPSRDYGDARPGARPPGHKIADERSDRPTAEVDKGY
jgi:hypothetical protein